MDSQIEKRLMVLEKQNARLKIGLCIGFAAVAVGACISAAPVDEVTDIVRAHEVRLVDKEGRLRIALSATREHVPGLTFYGDEANVTASLGVSEKGPSLVLTNKKGDSLVLAATDSGPGLAIVDKKQFTRLTAAMLEGEGALILNGESGMVVARAMTTGPTLGVFDAAQHFRAGASIKDGKPSLLVKDARGGMTWTSP